MEIWKDIEGYEGLYQVSNLGRVKSLDRTISCGKGKKMHKGKILSLITDKDGYKRISLRNHQQVHQYIVSRIVWSSFNGSIPNGMQVNHINENKADNRLANLNLMDCKTNINWGSGIRKRAKTITKPVIQILSDGNEFFCYFSAKDASKDLQINANSIQMCCSGYRYPKTAGGFKWRYADS